MVQLKDIRSLENGARFHNMDLHIHSYGGSHDVKDATMTPEAIVDSAVRQGLSVIAITDHNSNKNVLAAITHAEKNYKTDILVLAGVEVTTAHGHLLAYFGPDCASDLNKFLTRLDLTGEMGSDNTRTAKSMTDVIAIAANLGGVCIAAHIDREKTGFDKFAEGFQNWKKDIITSPGLYGLECDAMEALTWYSENDKTPPAGTERTKIFKARETVDELKARHHLAHVQGSDAHSMTSFEHKNPKKPWTRIKLSELTFEAVRVALVDPTARVRACAVIPASFPRLLGISMTGGFLDGQQIHFSDNLNCFIGGRGTGKSTAIRAVAYVFGLIEEFGEFDNCPDAITVYCQDENGIVYSYVRTRGGDVEVKAKEDKSFSDVPIDSFRIEYFGQGELAKVAEDPLKNPQLFQEFLDRHTNLRDLLETEQMLVTKLRENAARLDPLEGAFSQLADKRKSLAEIEKKLQVAEEGNLRGVVGTQSKIASEKAVRESIETIIAEYNTGYNFDNIQKSFGTILKAAGDCTDDPQVQKNIQDFDTVLSASNAEVKKKETELNAALKVCASRLALIVGQLKTNHQRMNGEIAVKIAALKASGLSADIPGLETLLKRKTSIAGEIATVERRSVELKNCQKERAKFREELKEVRSKMTERRKEQLKGINENLANTINDYVIFVKYDDAGITDDFETFMQEKMHGTYLQDDIIRNVCSQITPSDLADLVLNRDADEITKKARISKEWTEKIIEKLCYWNILFELQALSKPPKPIIVVRTRSTPPRPIPVLNLSDGQRHTILLTIAMLAESNVPLVIDQPEDDLDNAFVFSSIVKTLRSIKEKRQVIVVTHNANIAVLGDSELILPMTRENDCGTCKDKGSIDAELTKMAVQNILEGGPDAFLRRKEIYDH